MRDFICNRSAETPPLYEAYCDATLVSLRAPYEIPSILQSMLTGSPGSRLPIEVSQRLYGKPVANIGCGTIDLATAYEEFAFERLHAPTLASVDPFNLLADGLRGNHKLIRADGVGFMSDCAANSTHVITSSLDEEVFMGRIIQANYGLPQSHWSSGDRDLWRSGEEYIQKLTQLIARAIGDQHLWISYCSQPFEECARRLGLREYRHLGSSVAIFYQPELLRSAA